MKRNDQIQSENHDDCNRYMTLKNKTALHSKRAFNGTNNKISLSISY